MTTNDDANPLILRILCLHDNYSNAFDLQNELHLLGKKLYASHSVDLVYVNGPLIVTTSDSTIDEKQKYLWWEERYESADVNSNDMIDAVSRLTVRTPYSTSGGSECPKDGLEYSSSSSDAVRHATHLELPNSEIPDNQTICYDGLDASLMLLRQIWTSCPFWGILGVGKGAAVASLFTTLLESEMLTYHATTTNSDASTALPRLPIPPSLPQLIIFVSGESLLTVDEPLLVSNHFNTTQSTPFPLILHLVDYDISPEQELLMRQFSQGSQMERREKSHSSRRKTCSQHDLNIIGRFICQRKKGLYSSRNGDIESPDHNNQHNKILTLQTALYYAEQDAANCIAETITINPPAALMAVIRPQVVAGWKGNRRPQPEGGGAPCPEEFLHRSSKNTTKAQTKS
jgi:Serine hydrolase (FSH1)